MEIRAHEEQPIRGALQQTPRKRRLLLAEDDPDLRNLLALRLRRAGYEVVEAADGAELLSLVESSVWHHDRDPFMAIVSDVMMPDVSGVDALAGRRWGGWTTPVILMTASRDQRIREDARTLGAAAVLQKPFDTDVLCDMLQTLSGRRSSPPRWSA